MSAEAATPEGVIAEIQRILEVDLSITTPITAETDVLNQLALDSLALVTVIVGLEDRFKIALTEEDAAGVKTVGDLAALVVAKKSAKP
jgi:acyl carrier protein